MSLKAVIESNHQALTRSMEGKYESTTQNLERNFHTEMRNIQRDFNRRFWIMTGVITILVTSLVTLMNKFVLRP